MTKGCLIKTYMTLLNCPIKLRMKYFLEIKKKIYEWILLSEFLQWYWIYIRTVLKYRSFSSYLGGLKIMDKINSVILQIFAFTKIMFQSGEWQNIIYKYIFLKFLTVSFISIIPNTKAWNLSYTNIINPLKQVYNVTNRS